MNNIKSFFSFFKNQGKGILAGVTFVVALIVINWVATNYKALENTLLYPEAVAEMQIEVIYQVKK